MPSLNLDIVNNSAKHDDHVYIGLYAASVSGTVNGQPLKTIEQGTWYKASDVKTPGSVVIDSIVGGRVYVSFDKTFSLGSDGGMPSFIAPGSNAYDVRYDKAELTFDGTSYAVGDLTAIDFWSIPLSLKTLDSSGQQVDELHAFKGSTTFADLKSALSALSLTAENTALGNGIVAAFGTALSDGDKTAIQNPASALVENGSEFVRVIGPNSYPTLGDPVAGTPLPGLPFTAYGNLLYYFEHLKTQPTGSTGFATIAGHFGGAPGTGDQFEAQVYDLKAKFTGPTGTTKLELSGTLSPGEKSQNVTIEADWWDVLSASGVYGGSPKITVNGQPHANGNDVYAWILGDFFAGLNIGAIGSTQTVGGKTVGDMSSSEWFATLPAAGMLFDKLWPNQPAGKPFWNTWAATLNPLSDAYNFAYSERFSAPQISLDPAKAATLQVIIEADS